MHLIASLLLYLHALSISRLTRMSCNLGVRTVWPYESTPLPDFSEWWWIQHVGRPFCRWDKSKVLARLPFSISLHTNLQSARFIFSSELTHSGICFTFCQRTQMALIHSPETPRWGWPLTVSRNLWWWQHGKGRQGLTWRQQPYSDVDTTKSLPKLAGPWRSKQKVPQVGHVVMHCFHRFMECFQSTAHLCFAWYPASALSISELRRETCKLESLETSGRQTLHPGPRFT